MVSEWAAKGFQLRITDLAKSDKQLIGQEYDARLSAHGPLNELTIPLASEPWTICSSMFCGKGP